MNATEEVTDAEVSAVGYQLYGPSWAGTLTSRKKLRAALEEGRKVKTLRRKQITGTKAERNFVVQILREEAERAREHDPEAACLLA